MSKETEKILKERQDVQQKRLELIWQKTYDEVYKKSILSDAPAECKAHPDQCTN